MTTTTKKAEYHELHFDRLLDLANVKIPKVNQDLAKMQASNDERSWLGIDGSHVREVATKGWREGVAKARKALGTLDDMMPATAGCRLGPHR